MFVLTRRPPLEKCRGALRALFIYAGQSVPSRLLPRLFRRPCGTVRAMPRREMPRVQPGVCIILVYCCMSPAASGVVAG